MCSSDLVVKVQHGSVGRRVGRQVEIVADHGTVGTPGKIVGSGRAAYVALAERQAA
mgnify:CR=1 FL=1